MQSARATDSNNNLTRLRRDVRPAARRLMNLGIFSWPRLLIYLVWWWPRVLCTLARFP